MVFLRETINEQEVLLRRAAVDGRNDASTAVLSASISARVKALTEHLKVHKHTVFEWIYRRYTCKEPYKFEFSFICL